MTPESPMTAIVGTWSITGAVLAACAAVFASIAAVRFDDRRWLARARWLVVAMAGLITLACAALVVALVDSDFRIAYVVGYTERALPTAYKLAAFWAGQEGSILLWGWMIAIMSAMAVAKRRPETGLPEEATLTATLAVVAGFFAGLMLFAADPFALLPEAAADGHGLNPLLQDPAMVFHPPFLFLGYAGYTVPFAMLMGALAAGRTDHAWLAHTRRWIVASWLFLSIGILLGAQWAYIELGWGGYWAWDPVENASLLPWLSGTALLHSIMAQQHRDLFKRWNASLIAATFALCILGTWITRSGVIQSVHAFGKSLVGTLFLGFLLVALAVSVAVLAWRWRQLRSECRLEKLLSKEGAFLAANVLLTIMTVTTLVGTLFPLIGSAVGAEQVTVGPPFYNAVVVPMAVLLLAVMALGPLLRFGADSRHSVARVSIVPAIAATVVVVLVAVLGVREPWTLACAAVAGFAAFAVLTDLLRNVVARSRLHDEMILAALVQTLDTNHRRYGGQIVHVGMLMVMLGVAGSSLFGIKQDLSMTPGSEAEVAGYKIAFAEVAKVRHGNYTAVEARVTLTDRTGRSWALRPQARYYDKTEQPNAQVAMRWSLKEDVYLTLAGWEAGGAKVALQVMINPLVTWIWIGGIVLTLGGIFALLPRLLPQPLPDAADAHRSVRISLPTGLGPCTEQPLSAGNKP